MTTHFYPLYENPFLRAAPEQVAPAMPAAEGTYEYAIVQSAPSVPADECEVQALSIDLTILWASSVLHTAHLTPPRSFYVGEEERKNLPCDYLLPAEKIGSARAPVVLVDAAGAARLVLLRGATGTIEIAGQPAMTVAQALASGRAQPSAEVSGAMELPLELGTTASIDVNGIVFRVGMGHAGRAVAGLSIDVRALPYQGASLLAHAAVLAAMAIFMPPLGTTDEGSIDADATYMMQQFLAASAEKEDEARPTEDVAEDAKADRDEGGTGARAKNEEGSMGSQVSKETGKKYGVAGDKNNPDPHLARAAALDDASKFGAIGLLATGMGGDPNAPTSPWGRDDSAGNDAMSALGNMWGEAIGESAGSGGLGLSGIGEGGGGRFEGIGLGAIGTIGRGSGRGTGDGFGHGHGTLAKGHKAKSPSVRIGTATVGGRIPPEIIQRVVRQNFGRFRLCYENGLRTSPNLAGRVSVRFIIGRDGATSSVANGGSDLPNTAVVSCVVRAFYGLSFPAPEAGIVTVTYPIMFTPGG